MATRLHNRKEFYKYATASTALRVIESKRFLWRSPTLFNDPFDHQTGFVFSGDLLRLTDALHASIERTVFGDSGPSEEARHIRAQMIRRMRAIRDKLPKEQFLASMREGAEEVANNFEAHLTQLNAEMQTSLCSSRVFCVCEEPDNVVMWSHYADEHKGVVFRLGCIDALDNVLLAARKVAYTDNFLTFPDIDTYARHLTGEQPFDIAPMVWDLAYTKHSDWAYEREWRVHSPAPDEGHSLYSMDPRVFQGLYIGCRADPAPIIAAAKAHLPEMPIFRAFKSKTSFSLRFEQIGGS